jgi:protein TonB
MKIFSPVGIAVSLTVSVLLHASISLIFATPEVDEMLEGGVQGDVAVIGTSFADMVSRENMIARSEPDENTPVKPDPAEVQEETVPAERVSDSDTAKPMTAPPSESVPAKAAIVAAGKPMIEPPAQMAAVSSVSEPAKKPAEISETQKSPQTGPVQPAPAQTSVAPSAQRPTQSVASSVPLSSEAAPAASVETTAALADAEPVPDVDQAVQKPARVPSQTSTKVEQSARASAAKVTSPSASMQSVQTSSEQETASRPEIETANSASPPAPDALVAPAVTAATAQTVPAKPEPAPTVPTQMARLQPVTATEAADASDVAPSAEPGIPAPRVRPPQPDDGKIVASSTKRKAEKPAPQKKRKVVQKKRSAAKGKQSSTQRSAQNNSGKSTLNASRGGGSGSKKKAAGNARASNYPGLVYRKIQRTRQKRVGGRGSVRIWFSVSSSGGLAGISVAKSSGSKKIDQAAVAHIRRAAPFPAPPKGARRSFTIPVDIRR